VYHNFDLQGHFGMIRIMSFSTIQRLNPINADLQIMHHKATSAPLPSSWQMRTSTNTFAVLLAILAPATAMAQESTGLDAAMSTVAAFSPWYVLATGLALFVPAGLIMVSVSGMATLDAWKTALSSLGAIALASIAYWAIGFGLQFGGVGLVYAQPELTALVWEWSPLSVNWGSGWGVAGLSGWMLSGSNLSWLAYALFLGHLPWVFAAAALSVMALRDRTPALVAFLVALVMGGIVYPLAGNWIQGGGWLNALGRNLTLGHGFIDFAGAGSVFLVTAGFSLAALITWGNSTESPNDSKERMPTSRLPLVAILGALLMLGGVIGWLWSNPLQATVMSETGIMRGSINVVLSAAAGALIPLVYSWFVTAESHAGMTARGLAAGMVAGLAVGPFVQPGVALFIGLLAGATVPFVTYFIDSRMKLNDATGVVSIGGLSAMIGLLAIGIFADGAVGAGWQMTGIDSYLGISGQGVSGLLVDAGFQPDFPGQLQAQLIGTITLALWGVVMGFFVHIPLALITQGLRRSEGRRAEPVSSDSHAQTTPDVTHAPAREAQPRPSMAEQTAGTEQSRV
jgi:Amt family ammonium transporter